MDERDHGPVGGPRIRKDLLFITVLVFVLAFMMLTLSMEIDEGPGPVGDDGGTRSESRAQAEPS